MSSEFALETGIFVVDRHLMHPIFQWIDYQYDDYGGFGRLTDERLIGGYKNRLIAGVNLHNGEIDNKQFQNLAGAVKGNLLSSSVDRSKNISAYIENSFYFMPDVALVAGTQFLHAARDRRDRYLLEGDLKPDDSGRKEFDVWSPKLGLLWNVSPFWQVFANVSRSAEVPSFGENNYTSPAGFLVRPQIATTYEIGTRGRTPDFTWDLAAYRAQIKDELQCLDAGISTGTCNVRNLDRTVHQGIEIGFGATLLKSMFVPGARPDKLWLNVAYTLNDLRFDNDADFGDNVLPGAPRHFVRGELLYKHPTGIFAGPTVEWVPVALYVDNENTTKSVPYTLLGAKFGFDNGGPLSAYVEGRNLTDERYIASVSITDLVNPNGSNALYEPGTGRAVYGGVKYRW